TENKPVPLKTGEDEDYMLALKQDLRGTMKKIPYFLTVGDEHQGSFDYCRKSSFLYIKAVFCTDWRRLRREMKPKKANKKGMLYTFKKQVLQKLEKKDEEEEKFKDEKDKSKDKEGEDNEPEKSEEYDEEEHEEENDYTSSCFEDGDDFSAVSDDNMDEAIY
ncbi:RPC7 polymerase, partial [Aleadryas rufinucha]|nr:RPC7 polymerase [Aleadryas rufinucha]